MFIGYRLADNNGDKVGKAAGYRRQLLLSSEINRSTLTFLKKKYFVSPARVGRPQVTRLQVSVVKYTHAIPRPNSRL